MVGSRGDRKISLRTCPESDALVKTHLFDYGFRPNFLAAGVAAALLVPAWVASIALGASLPERWVPVLWHAHEMTFGFIAAAIGGFLLTAVPNWTGGRPAGGRALAALAVVWLLGRLAPFAPPGVGPWWIALADLAYLPFVAALIAPALLRARNRNRGMLLVLAALTFANAAFHCHAARGNVADALRWVHAALDLTIVLTAVIGGRIVPAFTNSGLRATGVTLPPSLPWLERATLAATVLIVPADLFRPDSPLAGVVALVAGLLHLVRWWRWQPWRTRGVPLVWVLHLGYGWLPVGLLLKAAAWLGAPGTAWLHALTVGALSTMILAVMTRASLGHTGRPLAAGRPIVAAYGLLFAAAVVRVFGSATGLDYSVVLAAAAVCWLAAFGTFVAVYAPILAGPRADGRPG
jgi:uncharacterized protein involved in response to NO